MNRRRYLAALLALGAGCSGAPQETPTSTPTEPPTTTPNPTATSTATPTSTPTSTPRDPDAGLPYIIQTNLLHSWDEFGDVYDNRVSRIPPAVEFLVGARCEIAIHDGEATLEMQAEVYRGEELMGRESNHTSTLTDASTPTEWEITVEMESEDWPTGDDYHAEVILQDETTGDTSDTHTVEFVVSEEAPEGA